MPDVIAPWISPPGQYRALKFPRCSGGQNWWGAVIDVSQSPNLLLSLVPEISEAIKIANIWNKTGRGSYKPKGESLVNVDGPINPAGLFVQRKIPPWQQKNAAAGHYLMPEGTWLPD
jgi:hypothetical protein